MKSLQKISHIWEIFHMGSKLVKKWSGFSKSQILHPDIPFLFNHLQILLTQPLLDLK